MPDKRIEKRNALKEKLLQTARATIASKGLDALRARDLAAEADCALGSVYNVFADLDDLILQVNAQTLRELGLKLAAAVGQAAPGQALTQLALAYADFARQNTRLWSALFDHRMADGGASPDWFLNSHAQLLEFLAGPLRALQPDLTDKQLTLRARTYFAAVHGIVSVSLQGRFLGLPDDALEKELSDFVATIAEGIQAKT